MRVTMPPLNRPAPRAGPEAYKTYQLLTPPRTHYRPALCAEVECPRQRNGWRSVVDVSTVDGAKQANWIRLRSGRAYTVEQRGTVVAFTFAAGQRCFGKHTVPLQREPFLRVVGGDWRGNPRQMETVAMRPQSWVDNFGEHQLSLFEAQRRG